MLLILAVSFFEGVLFDGSARVLGWGPGAGERVLFPMEEYTVPESAPAKVKEIAKELRPWLMGGLQEGMPSQEVQRKMAQAASVAYRERLKPPATVCSSSLQPGTRVLLTAFVAEGFYGSTALQQALMSAEHVGTLCAGDNWECEAHIDERRCEQCNAFDRPAAALMCIACAPPPHGVPNGTEAFRANLELFEPYWLANNKTVQVVKWGPIWPGSAEWDILGGGEGPTPEFDLDEIETATIPKALAASGVERVSWGIVIMHRPWCMWNMSSHARNKREIDLKVWATRTLFLTEKLVAYHRKYALDQVPVLMTNYAQLLWRPEEFVERVKQFAPCAGTVDLNFVPELGVDISEANMLKIEGSIIDYGQRLTPEMLHVQGTKGACSAPAHELYAGLDEEQQTRAQLAEDYLLSLAIP